jgi:ribose transport system permease protein
MNLTQERSTPAPTTPIGLPPGPDAAAGTTRTVAARRAGALAPRLITPVALAGVLFVFGTMTPVFLTAGNLLGVLAQLSILGLVATGLTIAVRAGGIDLSIGVALDLSALAAAALIYDGYRAWVAIVAGLLFGLLVGAINAALIFLLRIPPFLATLSVWFIGTSVQQLLTGGGAPIYLSSRPIPEGFALLGHGWFLDAIDGTILILVLMALGTGLLLGATRWGRTVTMAGEQPTAAAIGGLRVRRLGASAYILCSLVAALAGVVLASRTTSFVPGSGQSYLMDAIGAVFIGATLSKFGRATVPGTLVGVLLFALLSNGMNLIGLSFFWQGLGRGVVLLAILVLGVVLTRRAGAPSPLEALFRRPPPRTQSAKTPQSAASTTEGDR